MNSCNIAKQCVLRPKAKAKSKTKSKTKANAKAKAKFKAKAEKFWHKTKKYASSVLSITFYSTSIKADFGVILKLIIGPLK